MMIPLTKEEKDLYEKLKTCTDPVEQKRIRAELNALADAVYDELKDCPFEH